MQKLHNKDFQIAFKTGSDANKSKFAKECVQGELYVSDDSLYIAESSAGASDSALSKYQGLLDNNYSLSFDGGNDFINVPRDDGLNNSTLSFSAWVKFNVVNTQQTIIAKRTSSIGVYFQLSLDSNGKLVFYNAAFARDARVLSADTWYHLAVVHTGGTGGTTVIYIDGSGVSFNNTDTGDLNSTSTLAIGRLNSTYGQYMNGFIDEVGVWTTALSADNISTIYNSGVPGDISSLSPYYYYRMGDNDGGTGTTITDQGSGGNDGTSVEKVGPFVSVPSLPPLPWSVMVVPVPPSLSPIR